jgi:hypothetical protein
MRKEREPSEILEQIIADWDLQCQGGSRAEKLTACETAFGLFGGDEDFPRNIRERIFSLAQHASVPRYILDADAEDDADNGADAYSDHEPKSKQLIYRTPKPRVDSVPAQVSTSADGAARKSSLGAISGASLSAAAGSSGGAGVPAPVSTSADGAARKSSLGAISGASFSAAAGSSGGASVDDEGGDVNAVAFASVKPKPRTTGLINGWANMLNGAGGSASPAGSNAKTPATKATKPPKTMPTVDLPDGSREINISISAPVEKLRLWHIDPNTTELRPHVDGSSALYA